MRTANDRLMIRRQLFICEKRPFSVSRIEELGLVAFSLRFALHEIDTVLLEVFTRHVYAHCRLDAVISNLRVLGHFCAFGRLVRGVNIPAEFRPLWLYRV